MLLLLSCNEFSVGIDCKTKIIFTFISNIMINSMLSRQHFNYIQIVLFVAVSIIVLIKPLTYFPDSQGYVDMTINRSPMYPLFIGVLQQIFGSYFELVCKVLQLLIGLIAIRYFIQLLQKLLKLKGIWLLLLTLILLIPYAYNLNIANNLLSEALSYPLYLLVCALLLKALLTGRKKHLLSVTPVLFLLLLTRSQFIFIIPIALFIYVWISVRQRTFKKQFGILVIIAILPVLTSLTDKTYHKIVNGHFVSTQWTGFHFLSMAMFVADAEDVALFSSEKEQDYYTGVYNELARKGLNKNHLHLTSASNAAATYRANYSEIAVGTVFQHGKEILNTTNNLSENEEYIAVEAISRNMALPLILNNFRNWFKLYVQNFTAGFGSSKYALLFLILLGFGVIRMRKQPTAVIKTIAFGSFINVANIALVALGPHTIKRLTFYNDWVLFLIIFLVLNALLTSEENKSPKTDEQF